MTIKNRDERQSSGSGGAPAGKTMPDDKLSETAAAPENEDSSMESLVSQERTLAEEGARRELGREPSPEEADKWLDAHTEGY